MPPFPGPSLTLLGMFNSFSGKHFEIHGHYVLDIWPQNNKGQVLVMTNLHVKYKDFVIYSIQ